MEFYQMLPVLLAAACTLAIGAALFWPGRGWLARWHGRRQQMQLEDCLKYLHTAELESVPATLPGLSAARRISLPSATEILLKLERLGLVETKASAIQLTPAGRRRAVLVLRAHRLWERHLADETGYRELEWHKQAEKQEHRLTPPELEALAARLKNPTYDPHGDPIPTRAGETPPQSGLPLAAAPLDTPLRIVHIEDEPEPTYSELLAAGLYPGTELRVVERSATQMRIRVGRDEHILRSPVAANLLVQPQAETAAISSRARLSDLQVGERGAVVGIAPGCRRMERRRLQDLGVLPGTVIQAEFASPSSDPVAYRIRGALIALRREQAAHILVDRPEDNRES
jgi:DtxR family Mn-dependent transcriptional regulator